MTILLVERNTRKPPARVIHLPEDCDLPAMRQRAPWQYRVLHWYFAHQRRINSWVASALVHSLLLLVLALATMAMQGDDTQLWLTAGFERDESLIETLVTADVESEPHEQVAVVEIAPAEITLDRPDVALPSDEARDSVPHAQNVGFQGTAPGDLLATANPGGGGFGGRSDESRGKLAREYGGSPESEAAVRRGLAWLAAHQERSGRWQFNHDAGPCNKHCRHPGRHPSTTGATAMGLLPFLGAGQTHQSGSYQDLSRRALYYLMDQMKVTNHGGDLQQGSMYAQGLAAITLCEAYALTQDEALKPFAQASLDFIAYAQDPGGGGWRYNPGQPGDTSMHGWMLMAQKSGQMAYLSVPPRSQQLAGYFLDSVQLERGALYGYQEPGRGKATTAIGLLCRMYQGWRRDHPSLAQGVAQLDAWGPSQTDMYYNYYATQVLHHWEGEAWKRWNRKLRDYLVRTQCSSGHESGSWYFGHEHSEVGGRLYDTSLAVMTLEVYYRHLPLYRAHSVGDDF